MIKGRTISLEDFDGSEADYQHWFNLESLSRYNTGNRLPSSFYKKSRPDILLKIVTNTNEWLGNISLNNVNYIDSTAEIAIIISHTSSYGTGIGTEACYLLIKHAFYQLNLNRIYLGTHERNIGMQRIAEKLGFTKEGVRRCAIYKDAHYHDIIEYGILKSEFKLLLF